MSVRKETRDMFRSSFTQIWSEESQPTHKWNNYLYIVFKATIYLSCISISQHRLSSNWGENQSHLLITNK